MTRTILRAEASEKHLLTKIEAGHTYPHQAHTTPDEVFVVGSSYLHAGGTGHHTSSPAGSGGCTILVCKAGPPAK